ncbi:endoplasmic reticulum lectin 1-like [Gigantopelta aegis]|uniref:endoplasmic reticulum lectin 1-like n=1 Tax=Gigantopelta aegis TaxID=1735272 RepID=UPI001B889F14|nr:endoplasmic reticulum lectin 1-like [Gigantopelta aegis]
MSFFFNICIYTCLTVALNVYGGNIDPFMDSQLFMINWAGPLEIIKDVDENQMVMTTTNNEKYKCILPETMETKEEARKRYHGPTAFELMKTLFTQTTCSYRVESYWTYELCHGKHLRQYHETKDQGQKPKLQEYFLGLVSLESLEKANAEESSDGKNKYESEVKVRKIDGISLPYYEVNMTSGTPCDLTKEPRKARILYVCQPEGHGEIYQLKEMSTCEYEVIILTAVLCAHPDFRPKNPPVSQIQCHALDGSPPKPRQLHTFIQEETLADQIETQGIEFKVETTLPDGVKKTIVIPKKPDPVPTLGTTTDKQLIREFLTGDYCLNGGRGWWKFEFCYGKYARQYHDDKDGRTILYLGYWNEDNHKHWLQANYHKRPKDIGKRKHISLHYGGGDVCDETGTARVTEVKLKCVENPEHPHAVALFLMEPTICEYILVIESPIFCGLLDKANEDGIFQKVEI